jgi:hypothetical protein
LEVKLGGKSYKVRPLSKSEFFRWVSIPVEDIYTRLRYLGQTCFSPPLEEADIDRCSLQELLRALELVMELTNRSLRSEHLNGTSYIA